MMDALEALFTRVSVSRVGSEPPDEEAVENIFKAALRAPDHALLRPWRFLVIRGAGLLSLGKLFVEATRADEPDA
ncbi:MAG: nitroreductase family protein, partial [Pseudomonadales bacterium]|nr:nitroreductase family protein [Pseudomonadales bacterium]